MVDNVELVLLLLILIALIFLIVLLWRLLQRGDGSEETEQRHRVIFKTAVNDEGACVKRIDTHNPSKHVHRSFSDEIKVLHGGTSGEPDIRVVTINPPAARNFFTNSFPLNRTLSPGEGFVLEYGEGDITPGDVKFVVSTFEGETEVQRRCSDVSDTDMTIGC